MSGIHGKDTKPELMIRKGLHARGFRYRLHSRKVDGKPDLILPKYRATVFVHGCFWHSHHCHLFKMPSTRTGFWSAKLARNRQRDGDVLAALHETGWRVLLIWECALKGKNRFDLKTVLDIASDWIRSDQSEGEISGKLT